MFEQAFRNIDDALRKEAGCTTELDYTEQTSWLLFLKYLDGLEQDKADEAAMDGKNYAYILDKPYRWETWAAPKNQDGTPDHHRAMVGDDLTRFVNASLFPYLQKFTQSATGPNTIEYKIGQIFGEIKNKIHSGTNLREIIDEIDALRFRSQTEKHELSHLYEAKIKNMGNAGRNGGEYYTPRPLILTENLADIQEKDRYDIILANPPFGGKERSEVQQNFPIRTGETAYLFLQHFIKMLKAGGRAGVVIKNTFLSNTDNASISLRKMLLDSCDLHTILDCPGGTFLGAGVKTVVLLFDKGAPTRKVWYYQLDPGRNMGKTNPLNDADLAEFLSLQPKKKDSPKSWTMDMKTLDPATFDLSVKNPNGAEEITHRTPLEIMDEIAALDAESTEVLASIRGLL